MNVPFGRDWSKWLPPVDTAELGVVLRAGQVLAERRCGFASVFRLGAPMGDGSFEVEQLAYEGLMFKTSAGLHPRSPVALRAVIVQDVGQAEPTPPELLYATVRGGAATAGKSAAIKAIHTSVGADGKMAIAFTRGEEFPAELLPGDVITLGNHFAGCLRWRLVRPLSRMASFPLTHRWEAEPFDPKSGAFCLWMELHFTPDQVTGRVPAWRTGQRRRIRRAETYGIGGMIEGLVSKDADIIGVGGMRLEADVLGKSGDWFLRTDGDALFWASETEWSELLVEAPSVRVDGDVYWHGPATDPDQWHGWRPGQKRRVVTCNGIAIGYLRHSGNANPDDWMLDEKPNRQLCCHVYVGASSVHSTLLEEAPAGQAADGYKYTADELEHTAELRLSAKRYTSSGDVRAIVNGQAIEASMYEPLVLEPETPRPPLREVSSNGREWVNYDADLGDASEPFESYRRRRVDGVDVGCVEPAPGACIRVVGCRSPAIERVTMNGREVLCEAHFLDMECGLDVIGRNDEARARMAEMDRRATDPPPEPSCQPTLFGGIWRPW